MFLTKDNSAIKLLKFQGLVAYKNVLSGFKYKEWNLKMKISKKSGFKYKEWNLKMRISKKSGFKYKEWNLKMKISKKRKVSDIIEKDTELIT